MELVISMGVLAIVGGTIGMLMIQGSKSYRNSKSELDLQMESQTVMAQLNTMIMESNLVHYDAANDVMTLYQIETLPASAGAVTIPKKVKNIKFVERRNDKLYLYEHDHDQTKPASGGSVGCSGCGAYKAGEPQEAYLLADYVEDFSVTPQGEITKESPAVTVTLNLKSGTRTYKADITTKVRNKRVAYP